MCRTKKFFVTTAVLGVFLISGFLCEAKKTEKVLSPKATKPEKALKTDKLENVLMPDAFVVGRVDLVRINQSPIAKLIKKGNVASVNQMNTVLEKHNLSDKDFTSFVIGLKFDVEKAKGLGKALLNNGGGSEFVFGIQSLKSISINQLKSIVADSYVKNGIDNLRVEAKEKAGISYLLVTDKENGNTQTLALTICKKEKIIIGGDSPETIISSANRLKTGKAVVFSSELTKLRSRIAKDADFYLIGYLSDAVRGKLGLTQKKVAKKKAKNGELNTEVLKDINALAIQADFTKKLKVNIHSYFKARKSAEDTQKLFNQFVPMLTFIVMNATKGVSLPLLDSIKCELSKTKPELVLSLTLTEKDVKTIQKLTADNNKKQPKHGK